MAAAAYDMIPIRVLTGDQHPHFAVINEFRWRHLEKAWSAVWEQLSSETGRRIYSRR
jgi:hypothetical protein